MLLCSDAAVVNYQLFYGGIGHEDKGIFGAGISY